MADKEFLNGKPIIFLEPGKAFVFGRYTDLTLEL